ncbi:MAG: acyl-CoA dehydrogenase family protein, partial [Chitinophagales bacterium]
EWNEEQLMIASTVKEFCIKEIQEKFFERGKEYNVTDDADKAEVLKLLKKAGELGLCGVSIPEEYGGMGLDFKTNTLFSSVISNGFSFATTLGAQTSIGSLPIVYYGNDAQKEKYLPKIATGEYVAAYALTEPGAGSDANSGKTRAKLNEDKSHYLLNGQKIWITNGGFADVYAVFAKIEDDKDLSAFIVERNFPGFSTGPEEKKMGIKGSSTVQIYFDDCKVPAENLLGERGAGFKMALNILNGGRIKAGAGGIGGAQLVLNQAVPFAIERKQFNQSISEFGAIQYKIGSIAAEAFCCEAAVYRTVDKIDRLTEKLLKEGKSDNEAKLGGLREFAIEASIIKVKGSELVCLATDEGIQIYGGMGYAVETGMEMGYRDARITKIYEGTNEVNRMLAVGELSKRAVITKELDLISAGKKIPGFIFKQILPFKSNSNYAAEKRLVQGLKNTFLMVSGAAGKKLGKKLVDEQEIVLNFYDILAEAYVCDSVLMKIEKLEKTERNKGEKFQVQKSAMQLYLYVAANTAKRAAHEAIDSFANGLQKSMLKKLVNIMLPAYPVNPKELRRKVARYIIDKKGYAL